MTRRWRLPASPSISTTRCGSRGPCWRMPRQGSTSGSRAPVPTSRAPTPATPSPPTGRRIMRRSPRFAMTSPAPAFSGSNPCSREWGYETGSRRNGVRVFREHRQAVTLFDDAARVLGKLGERLFDRGVHQRQRRRAPHRDRTPLRFRRDPGRGGGGEARSRHLRACAERGRRLARERGARRATTRCATWRARPPWGCAPYG